MSHREPVSLRLTVNDGELVVERPIPFAGRKHELAVLAKAAEAVNTHVGFEALRAELVEG